MIATVPLHRLDKLLDVLTRMLHLAAAFEIGLPLRGQGQGLGGVGVEGLGHQRDQVADYASVVEQRFNDRMRQFSLTEFGCFRFRGVDFIVRHHNSGQNRLR